MRHYEKNSPKAAARFLVLAALSDGDLDRLEFTRLDELAELCTLGVNTELIDTVLGEFCVDVKNSQSVDTEDNFQLKPSELARLLMDIDDPALQRTLGRAALQVIGTDNRVHRGESVLLWAALDAWNLHLMDFVPASASASMRVGKSVLPSLHFG